MQLPNSSELDSSHAHWWKQFCTIYARERLPHALLLIGPQHADLADFSYKMASVLLCSQDTKPCGTCKSCRLLQAKEHPDVNRLQPEKAGGIIKIDQIRELQTIAFTSPQLGEKRVIIIHPAEKMNIAAANALLKLLEEPPSCLFFVLIAEQISTVLPTILSRCQQWRFPNKESTDIDYLAIGEYYNPESERGKIFSCLTAILQDLMDLKNKKTSVCGVATRWLTYEFNELIWLLYLLNSQLIQTRLARRLPEKSWSSQVYQLSQYFHPVCLFHQLDELNRITKKMNQNISINQTLALENLLLRYMQD
ncbi:DNA polymerase III subunit delta' [Legionella jamestowniensis]|uniref:DNA polymerase III subunit delta' n=1 Tax=Legionella jamestowniensis TaxID=455 RepID=A0A0W0UNJ4_9GAMM|nr:DNA polymerase III subunit delta' [Legionella jamestowniensis]KTD09456.1 DNA polymerase III, delta' subunit [Legionella jamestowniensis]SFL89644.1 DNA polymerase-3 subunit delta' [Legionella jamestowniensis DSM 19215]